MPNVFILRFLQTEMGNDHRQETWLLEILLQGRAAAVQPAAWHHHRRYRHASELVRFLPDFAMRATRYSGTDAFQRDLG